MSTMIQKAANLLRKGRETAAAKYRDMIRADTGDARSLATVLDELDVTPSQAEADAMAVREAAELAAAAPTAEALAGARAELERRAVVRAGQVAALRTSRADAVTRVRESIQEEQRLAEEGEADRRDLAALEQQAASAAAAIAQLRARHPLAFDQE